MAWQAAAIATLGVLLIGVTNLIVSFSLAMWIGLKARGVDLPQRFRLVNTILRRCLARPGDFFLPPRPTPPETVRERPASR